jgi:hypothetical protein
MEKHQIPPPSWKLPDFELEPINVNDLHRKAFDAASYMNQTIERLCERARAKGPHVRLAIGSLEQDPRTFGWNIPYAFLDPGAEHGALIGRTWTIFGPWPSDAKKGGEAEAPPPLCGC